MKDKIEPLAYWKRCQDGIYRPYQTCRVCGAVFTFSDERGNVFACKYCKDCYKQVRREKTRARVKRLRERQRKEKGLTNMSDLQYKAYIDPNSGNMVMLAYKHCTECGREVTALDTGNINRVKYCTECKAIIKREQAAECSRRYREKQASRRYSDRLAANSKIINNTLVECATDRPGNIETR